MKSIAFVESRHKIDKIKVLLEKRWPGETFDVFYSGGTLLSLPKVKHGILAKESLRPTGFQLTSSGSHLASILKDRVKQGDTWKYCLLLSDDDWEGESIAEQLINILNVISPNVIFYRMKLSSLDERTFLNSPLLDRLDENVISARDCRVAADSIINTFLTKIVGIPETARPGRVVTAVAKMLYSNSGIIPSKVLQIAKGMPNGAVAVAQIVNPSTDPRVYVQQAKRLAPDDFKPLSIETSPPPKPFNIFDLASEVAGFEIKNGLQLAQYLYANGKISYFRTEDTFFTEHVAEEMQRFLKKFYLKLGHASSEDSSSSVGIGGAHGGIYPLTQGLLTAQFSSSPSSVLERLISARAMASQMGNAIYEIGCCESGAGYPTSFKSIRFIDKGWTAIYERLGLPNPVTSLSADMRHGRISRRTISSHVLREQFAFNWLQKNRIAKPPTLASLFPMLKATGWMDKDGRVSNSGEDWLSSIYRRSPALLEASFSISLYSKLEKVASGSEPPSFVLDFVLSNLKIDSEDLLKLGVLSEKEHSPWRSELMLL